MFPSFLWNDVGDCFPEMDKRLLILFFVLGEANFSDHGSNRLGASALMQGLADGYFVLPYTINDYLNKVGANSSSISNPSFLREIEKTKNNINNLLNISGKQSPTSFHKKLGNIMWQYCGMARNHSGLSKALNLLSSLEEEFETDIKVSGKHNEFNQSLEKAIRIKDFIHFAKIICYDALERNESCGGHFRTEHQTEDGEAKRDDKNFTHVATWLYKGKKEKPSRHTEELTFENVSLVQRSYK
jgi:succinate dehydrogenase / fumarate reductase flavoprotein subunit